MKRLVSAIVIAVMLCGSCPLALAGSAYGVSPEEVTGIKLEQSVSVAVGNEYTLTWYVLANDESDDISVTFSSTDESIVTVNDEGTLRGIAPGDAVVTATTVEGGFTADCAVKVTGNGSITPTVDHNMYVFDYGGDFFRFSTEDTTDCELLADLSGEYGGGSAEYYSGTIYTHSFMGHIVRYENMDFSNPIAYNYIDNDDIFSDGGLCFNYANGMMYELCCDGMDCCNYLAEFDRTSGTVTNRELVADDSYWLTGFAISTDGVMYATDDIIYVDNVFAGSLPEITSIEMETNVEVGVLFHHRLDYQLFPSNADLLSNLYDLSFGSSDESVATVSQEGIVFGVGVGSAEITMTDNASGVSSSCTVSVSEIDCLRMYGFDEYTSEMLSFSDTDPNDYYTYSDALGDYEVSAAEYFNGYVYGYTTDRRFFSAPLDSMDSCTISEAAISSLTGNSIIDISFNYADCNMYALVKTAESTYCVGVVDMTTGEIAYPMNNYFSSVHDIHAFAIDMNGIGYYMEEYESTYVALKSFDMASIYSGSTTIVTLYIMTNVLETLTYAGLSSSNNRPFRGNLNGDGHIICGLYINTGANYKGLFGYTYDGIIQNIGIYNSYIRGGSYVGAFVGYHFNVYSVIHNCVNAGTVCGNAYVGGFVGESAYSGASRCVNMGTVTSSGAYAGGIFGNCIDDMSVIYECSNQGSISGTGNVGGMTGYRGRMSFCSNSGTITGTTTYIGGISGVDSLCTSCINSADIYGGSMTGGISGGNNLVNYCVNTGIIHSTAEVGGIMGGNGSVSNSYYIDTCGGSVGGGTALSDELMRDKDSYEGFDFRNVWVIEPTTGNPYPQFMRTLPSEYGEDSSVWDGTTATHFSKGTGTESFPYMITNASELAYLAYIVNNGNSYSGTYFRLTTDIILNDYNAENWIVNATVWTPIKGFSGNFDGNGHTISGIYSSGFDYQGLFGSMTDGVISNLTITDSFICASSSAGACVGLAERGSISNCHTMRTVTVYGMNMAGGVVGNIAQGTVSNCVNEGVVYGSVTTGGVIGQLGIAHAYNLTNRGVLRGTANVGGIIGYDYLSSITNCDNYGEINGMNNVGGIVGIVYGEIGIDTGVTDCVNYGNVLGGSNVGGIFGGTGAYTSPSLDICNYSYNMGDVSGDTCVGGITGSAAAQITLSYCYNTASISGNSSVGGIAGNSQTSISFCYNTGSITGNSGAGAINGVNGGGVYGCYYLNTCGCGDGMATALSSQQMQSEESFAEYDFINVWAIEPRTGYGFPQFMESLDASYGEQSAVWDGSIADSFASGNGSPNNPYVVSNASELAYFAATISSSNDYYEYSYITLSNDIVLNNYNAHYWILNAVEWSPINGFRGVFDGAGHTISGIYINRLSNCNGLFGSCLGAEIYNVTVKDSYIYGAYHVGGIVGQNITDANISQTNASVVSGCTSYATVNGLYNVGGIAGYMQSADGRRSEVTYCKNYGSVRGCKYVSGISSSVGGAGVMRYCYNVGSIYGASMAGGIAGCCAFGILSDSYNCGEITGYTGIAGLTGFTRDCSVSNCYNIGFIDAIDAAGVRGNALIGSVYSVVNITNCYYLDSCGDTDGYGTSLTDAQLCQQQSYNGFDFDAVWTMDGSDDYAYAELVEMPHTDGDAHPLLGDVNGDGSVTGSDAILIMRYVLRICELSQQEMLLADVNGDGVIDLSDTLLAMRIAIGAD